MSLSNQLKKQITDKARIRRQPVSVSMELLPVCNLNCAMCYIRSEWEDVKKLGGLKTVDEWLTFAQELLEAGTLFLLLTGGEIFLYPEIKRLYIELYKMGFSITLNTNATMIDEDIVQWLNEYPPECISISLYGSNDTVYEKLCKRKGMFSRVDHAITLLQKNGIVFELKTMITPYNIDDLKYCVDYANQRNISYEATAYSFPPIRKIKDEEQVRFSPQQVVDSNLYFIDTMFTEAEMNESVIGMLKKYENTVHREGYIMKGLSCSACNYSCWINWQGKMTPCAMLNEPFEDPFEKGFMNSWEKLKLKVDDITMSSACANCDKREICTVCPASACAETGHLDGTSTYHCMMSNYLIERLYQYVEEHKIEQLLNS